VNTQTDSPTTASAWPEGVIARYLTVAGAALGREDLAVDVETLTTYDFGDPYATRATCRGCTAWRDEDYALYRNYRDETARAKAAGDAACGWAQAHAEKCRALPRPGAGDG
jgi:hypothetical protein